VRKDKKKVEMGMILLMVSRTADNKGKSKEKHTRRCKGKVLMEFKYVKVLRK
jgi:hypothetical protein